MNLLCLLFGDPDENGPNRWPLAKQLFDFGFNNFQTMTLSAALANAEPIQIQVANYAANDAGSGIITFSAENFSKQYVTLENDVAQKILDGTYTVTATATYDESIAAPITEGQVIGTVTYTCVETEDEIFSGDLIAPREVVASGMEPDASGNTAVATMPPVVPEEIVTSGDNMLVWIWLIIPAGLVVFLVIRLVTVNKRKRRRFKKRRPHYSYRIK
jgi:D-alanyl-D-alanine carboxypeptidase